MWHWAPTSFLYTITADTTTTTSPADNTTITPPDLAPLTPPSSPLSPPLTPPSSPLSPPYITFLHPWPEEHTPDSLLHVWQNTSTWPPRHPHRFAYIAWILIKLMVSHVDVFPILLSASLLSSPLFSYVIPWELAAPGPPEQTILWTDLPIKIIYRPTDNNRALLLSYLSSIIHCALESVSDMNCGFPPGF